MTVAVGNLYDKYDTKNPLARWLMRGFLDCVTRLAQSVAPQSILEVGCGEGRLSQHLFERVHPARCEACDLSLERIDPRCDSRITFREASVYELPYAAASFDLVVCCEVLEHLERPDMALSELSRVAARSVIVSTPNEPLFRGLNLLRGAHLTRLGNTPGHIQHFTPRSLRRLVATGFEVKCTRTPWPWIVVLAAPRAKPGAARDARLR